LVVISFKDFSVSTVVNFDVTLNTGRLHEMKTNTLLGIVLIAIGIVAFAYQGITYTTRENVVDLGPIHMTAERTRTIPLPPIVGALALVGGIVLLVTGSKKG
jgi:amino acid transporter